MRNVVRLFGAVSLVLATAVSPLFQSSGEVAAAGCTLTGSKTATSTTAIEISGCDWVQARISRYYLSTIYTYYSAQRDNSASVSSSVGSDAGHAIRGTGTPWVSI